MWIHAIGRLHIFETISTPLGESQNFRLRGLVFFILVRGLLFYHLSRGQNKTLGVLRHFTFQVENTGESRGLEFWSRAWSPTPSPGSTLIRGLPLTHQAIRQGSQDESSLIYCIFIQGLLIYTTSPMRLLVPYGLEC